MKGLIMHALTYLRGRRLWFVREYTVWGLADDAELLYLGLEQIDSTGRLMFGKSTIGGAAQNALFGDMVDFRGNRLPTSITSPRVVPRPRSPHAVYMIGEESDTGFRIARDPDSPGPIATDLFVFELG